MHIFVAFLSTHYLIKEQSVDEVNTIHHHNTPVPDDDEQTSINYYEQLKQLDPERAAVLHPNDTRKVLRYAH